MKNTVIAVLDKFDEAWSRANAALKEKNDTFRDGQLIFPSSAVITADKVSSPGRQPQTHTV